MLGLIKTKKASLYQDAQKLLLDPQNYTKEVDTSLVQLYLDFLNQSLEDVEYRLANMESFLRDVEGLMVSKMYPFAFMKEEVYFSIHALYEQVVKLGECYDILSTIYEESQE